MSLSFSTLPRFALVIVVSFSSIAARPSSQSTIPLETDTQRILDDLGGVPCSEDSAFTCVTIDVPLDHFHPEDTRSIPVVFAVLPASGQRKGMFVTAVGGPGLSGVLSADDYSAGFEAGIFEAFDLVFFDQRGIGLSGGLTCPIAATWYYQQDFRGFTNKQENALKETASAFASGCVDELASSDLLPYLGTRQAVEDLEIFRQIIGDQRFWLYGESYGTQYAQTYAAVHGDRLAGLILDGTVDLTLSGFDFYSQQAQAFNDVLVATLSACNDDAVCAGQMRGNAITAYDQLAARLNRNPLSYNFPLPSGRMEKRKLTLSDLEYVASSQLYGESDRMMFTRGLAAYIANGDIVPLARLLYIDLVVDPVTLEIIDDPSWSDAVFYGVECQDYGYPGGTPNERAELYLDAMDLFEISIPRLASIIYGDLPCAYWPNASSDPARPGYLQAEGIPTLVLGATADPATPVSHGQNVYRELTNGYLITTTGGPHVTFGYGNDCPDALVTDFLLKDVLPPRRETICEGMVAADYVPVAPALARAFPSPVEALSSVETEISYMPEFFYWDGFTPTSVGCTYGGTFDFEPHGSGARYDFELDRCQFINNFRLHGSGYYQTERDRFVLDVKVTGRWSCDVRYTRRGERINITGKCAGKRINVDRDDLDPSKYQMPDFAETKRE